MNDPSLLCVTSPFSSDSAVKLSLQSKFRSTWLFAVTKRIRLESAPAQTAPRYQCRRSSRDTRYSDGSLEVLKKALKNFQRISKENSKGDSKAAMAWQTNSFYDFGSFRIDRQCLRCNAWSLDAAPRLSNSATALRPSVLISSLQLRICR